MPAINQLRNKKMNGKITTFIILLSVLGFTTLSAQSFLDQSAARLGITVNIPSQYQVSKNESHIYPAGITADNPVPDIDQQYQQKTATGKAFFNSFFGTVTSVLTHNNNECVVLLFIPPGRGGSNYGKITTDSITLNVFQHISFGRIKHDFSYESPYNDASEIAALELYSMLTHYPVLKAKEMFVAGAMVSYPLNFKTNVFLEKFTRGRAVVIGKDRREVYLYFMLTDKSVMEFEQYLSEFNSAFVFYQ
jgi:hypothetical protein